MCVVNISFKLMRTGRKKRGMKEKEYGMFDGLEPEGQ